MNATNHVQIDYWNGRAGEKWAEKQVPLDRMLSHATSELVARAGPLRGQRVLDVGCGTGETCLLWHAAGAEVTGIDVSAPMLAVATERACGRVALVEADAAVWRGSAPFDLAVSRFGLMFFSDPARAFATLAANLRPGGRLLFTCWRALAENEWVAKPLGAVRDLLPDAPPPTPHAPGPFALADAARLRDLLEGAGFSEVAIAPFDFPVGVASEGGVPAAVRFVMQIGPTGAALAEASKATRAVAAERLATVLAPHDRDGLVTLGGALWMVEAVRGC